MSLDLWRPRWRKHHAVPKIPGQSRDAINAQTEAGDDHDNNASERALRRIALGRKNYLFVGDVDSGKSLAGLYSLVTMCESLGGNPFDYLVDVLSRVRDHRASAIDELLPGPS